MKQPSKSITEALARLASEAADHGRGAPYREIARGTGGVPVYADLSGGLAVKSDGTVVHYSWETREVREADSGMKQIGLVRLVREHPALEELLPERPPNGVHCPACKGTGIVLENLDCGQCLALGWLVPQG